MFPIFIAPSILAADYTRLGEELRRVEAGGADWIHVDVMDGHFVPNLTFGPGIVSAARTVTRLPMDVHLMIHHPERHLEAFAKAGADRLTVHVEAEHDVDATLRRIGELGCKPGISLNPDIDPHRLEPFLERVDLVLCMSVFAGFGGQSFMPSVLKTIRFVAGHPARRKRPYHIQVDGGINDRTAADCARAGVNSFVAGTSVFRAPDPAAAIRALREAAQAAAPIG